MRLGEVLENEPSGHAKLKNLYGFLFCFNHTVFTLLRV